MKAKSKPEPLFACRECGHKFFTVAAAERAASGSDGCPGCGGSDIEIYVSPRVRIPMGKGIGF